MNLTAPTIGDIESILRMPSKVEWSVQGLGMLRAYLDDDGLRRLHVWDDRLQAAGVSDVHDHPWDFRSVVLSGVVRNRRFVEVPYSNPWGDVFFKQQIVCGPGGGPVSPLPESAYLFGLPIEEYERDGIYQQRHDELHASFPSNGAVSIIARKRHDESDYANVFWHGGGDWVTAEPRPATDDEVGAAVELALRRWRH